MNTIDVVVGRIGKPHGLRGEVTVDVRTDEPERRFALGAVLRAIAPRGATRGATHGATQRATGGATGTLTVTGTRVHQGVWLVAFAEIADRTAAEAARGTILEADIPTQERPADPEEFYDHQLVGLTAYDEQGTRLGQLTAVVHGAAQDLLTITTDDGREALVPFVSALVPEVDVSAGRLVIADRPGLVTPFPED